MCEHCVVCFDLTVESGSLSDCQSKHRTDTTASSGYLASYKSSTAVGIGTAACPWYIRVGRGQKVNLTLFNFILPSSAARGLDQQRLPET